MTKAKLALPLEPDGAPELTKEWWVDAACREMDKEMFFPGPGEQAKVAAAKAVCAGCVVRGVCLEEALAVEHGSPYGNPGVFGGASASERAAMRNASYGYGA